MRSNSVLAAGQEVLWSDAGGEGLDSPPAERRVARRPARRPATAPVAELFDPSGVLSLEGDEFAASGWPAGTLMHLTPSSRGVRGELVVVREAGRTRVGWFAADRGRPALQTDTGTVWLSDRARVVALVTAVEPTLGC